MKSPTVCYIARGISTPPAEGFHVGSRRIVDASLSAGVSARVITIESDVRHGKNSKNWTTLTSKMHSFSPSVVFSPLDDLFSIVKALSYVKSMSCKMLHVLNVNKEAYAVVQAIFRIKLPVLIHFFHTPDVLEDDVFWIRNIALKMGFYGKSLNNHVVTTSHSMSNFFVEKLGVDSKRVHYCPFPIDTNFFRPFGEKGALRKKLGLPVDRSIVFYAGSIQPVRGAFDLVQCFQYVVEKSRDVLLLVSHPQRPEEIVFETQLRQQISRLGLEKNVKIIGSLSNIEEAYNAVDIAVVPLKRPYWLDPPLVLLEALSSGTPTITTAVGAVGEVAQDNENTLLTIPGDQLSLAKSIVRLLENPNERRKISTKAREKAVQEYSYDVVGKKLAEIYGQMLNEQA